MMLESIRCALSAIVRLDRMSDYRGIPSPVCPCGSNLFRLTATFDDETYEISGYFLDDASCAECGSLVTAPTPLDVIQA